MKILFKTKFGSHLYGTNTPSSDEDFKGVFQVPLRDIILRKDSDTIHEDVKVTEGVKFKQGDTNVEWIELRRFLKDAMGGQTYALDMIFSPNEHHEVTSPEWQYVIEHRSKLLSRHVAPYIGYCRQQAGKYGLKGSRLGELIRVIDHLRQFKAKRRLGECLEGFVSSEFVYPETKIHIHAKEKKKIPEDFLCVLGKYFPLTRYVDEILSALELMDKEYGERARLAQENKGVDWKAISHAYRCCYQLIDLAEKHEIVFPLVQAPYLKSIKAGDISYSIVQEELPILMQQAIDAVEVSTLPEQPDREFWEEFIISTYIK